MSNIKISQLNNATTPLAGTEVVPIVQSGSTKKVSVSNIVAGKQDTLTLTTTGTSGAATLVGSTLNIPQYSGGSANPSVIALSATDGTAVTGTTVDTLSRSLLIPANTFTGNGMLEILARFTKSGTAGSINTRVYLNTSASLTGATLIATFNAGSAAGTVYSQGIRTARINSNTLTVAGLASTGVFTDYSTGANPMVSTTFTTSVDNYLIFSVQLANSGDTGTCVMARATKYE